MSEEYIRRLSVIVRLNKWKSDIADIYGENDEYVKCIEDVISIVDSIPKVETEPVRYSCVKDNGCCLICDSPIPTDAGLDRIARNEVRYCYFCGAIKLPCKVGDRVYPLSCYGYGQGYKIISVNYYAEAGCQSCEFKIESDDHEEYDTFELDDIGIRVFFDKDERDKKLDECMQKEEEAALERIKKENEG